MFLLLDYELLVCILQLLMLLNLATHLHLLTFLLLYAFRFLFDLVNLGLLLLLHAAFDKSTLLRILLRLNLGFKLLLLVVHFLFFRFLLVP